jgi:hypothetical protein
VPSRKILQNTRFSFHVKFKYMRTSIFDIFKLQIAASVGTVGVYNSTYNKTKNTNRQTPKHAIIETSTYQRTFAKYQCVTPIDAERVRKLVPLSNDASVSLHLFRHLLQKVQPYVDQQHVRCFSEELSQGAPSHPDRATSNNWRTKAQLFLLAADDCDGSTAAILRVFVCQSQNHVIVMESQRAHHA